MKVQSLPPILIILAAAVIIAGCSGPAAAPPASGQAPVSPGDVTTMKVIAHKISVSIDHGLAEIEGNLSTTAEDLETSGLSGGEAERILNENLLRYPWAVSSVVITKDGIVAAAMPKNSAGGVGSNLAGKAPVIAANAARVPFVSGVFKTVEGYSAVSQSFPIYSKGGEYVGYADITYEPQVFLARQIRNTSFGPWYSIWIAQADGTQLYDEKYEEIGKNILTDPSYNDPALHAVLSRIAQEKTGTGTYSYWDGSWNRVITKEAVWDTAGIDGAEWRVVVTKEAGGGAAPSATTPAAPTATPAVATDARMTNLTMFVDRAAAYAKEHGKDAALREFTATGGQFFTGDMYVFAYGSDGTVLALPYQKGLIGTDRTGVADSNGVKYVDRMKEIAKAGGGYLYYIYANPADNYREEFKITYVRPVDSSWFVGSGIYLTDVPAQFDTTEKDQLTERVKLARDYAQDNGAVKAIRDFNDKKGSFADGSRYIFAYGFNGTTLAMPFQPEAIGTDRTNFTDSRGVKITAWEMAVAKAGGGFVYVDYVNPVTGLPGIKLCYVVPVDDRWFVGSGIYTSRL